MAVNILMLGGKRCGKTTVLASMNSEINRALSGTNLQLTPLGDTGAKLAKAAGVIQAKIKEFSDPFHRTTVDENPTSAKSEYHFSLTLWEPSKRSYILNIPVNIVDVPGEWLTQPVHEQELRGLIAASQIIIIAIDTPYLFSKMGRKGYGEYHEQFNKPDKILHFFQNSVSVQVLRDRMVLFVPIKCERYYHLTYSPKLNINGRNYMQELFEAVCAGYAPLLRYFRAGDGLHNGMTLAVTPILSAGGIDFVKFGMKKDEQTQTEYMVSYYQEPEFLSDAEKGYNPKFCEQPLVYALAYVLKLELNRGAGNQKGWLQNTQNANLLTIQQVYETFRNRMIRSENGMMANNGFFMIQNPQNI